MKIFLLALLWGIWCLGHSALISQGVQEFLRNRLAGRFRFYRLFYNLFALISLVPVLTYSHNLKSGLLFSWRGPGLILWTLLWGLAAYLGVQGAKAYDMGYFLGLKQALKPVTEMSSGSPFTRSGILSVIRHPWYLAALILFWIRSRNIYLSTLAENLILTLYIFMGIHFEEKKLVKTFGDSYLSYKKTVPALVPFGRTLCALIKKP